MPASSIEPAVGAATWPVGAQVCNGQMPASTANPRNKTGKAQVCICGVNGKCASCWRSRRPGSDVNGKDPDENERAAEKGIKRQLHRAVFLVGRSPDRDEEIFRHDHQLVENEEEKEIGAEEDAVGTADDEKQPEEKFVRPLLHVPGKEDRADRGQPGHQGHRETDAVDGEMVIHPKRRHPRHADDRAEMREVGGTRKKRGETDRESAQSGGEGNPAGQNSRQKQAARRAPANVR